MTALFIIVIAIGAIVMARYSYVQINQGKRTWLAVTVLGVIFALAMVYFVFEFIDYKYIGLTVLVFALALIGMLPGAFFGWLCTNSNARKITIGTISQIPVIGSVIVIFLKTVFTVFLDALSRTNYGYNANTFKYDWRQDYWYGEDEE